MGAGAAASANLHITDAVKPREETMSAKITQALHQVMSSVGYVQKTGKNAFHGYKYAGEADLLEKLRPAMLEAGLLLIPSVESVSAIDEHGITHIRMAYTLVHKDGDVWPEKIYAAGEGGDKNKNGVGDKGLYKAITGANKYLLFKLFQIETGDDPERDEVHDPVGANDTTPKPRAAPARVVAASILSEPDAGAEQHKLVEQIGGCVTYDELEKFIASANFISRVSKLPDRHRGHVREAFKTRAGKLKPKEEAA